MAISIRSKRIIKVLVILAFVWFIIYIFNLTPFLYQPPKEYKEVDISKIARDDFRPIQISNPDSDTLILFFHGYKSTPLAFKYYAEHFSSKYNVLVPIHPGHGTTKEDFKKTYFSQWYQHARDVYLAERKKFQKVYICGHSMGGLITLRLVEEFSGEEDKRPAAAITISAPVFLDNFIGTGQIYDWRLYLIRFVSWIVKEMAHTLNTADTDGAPETQPDGYKEYNFPPQAYSIDMGMYQARKNLDKITIPMLLMHAKGDKTVPYDNLMDIARHISSYHIKLRTFDLRGWDHNRHSLPLYNSTRDEVLLTIEEFLRELED
jgi:carboxylesterase